MAGSVTSASVEHLIAIANSLTDPRDADLVRQFAKERQQQHGAGLRDAGQFPRSRKRIERSASSKSARTE
jgi:hypothetical protein